MGTRTSAALAVLLLLLAGCSQSRGVRASMEAGKRAMDQRALRTALGHFRAAAADAPGFADAHLSRAQVAEALGEFDEALEAYRAAADLAREHRVPLGSLAERMGQPELALQALEGAEGSWRQHALAGGLAAGAAFATCAAEQWPQVVVLWRVCAQSVLRQGRDAFTGSQEALAAYRFQILVESGERERALALAWTRGWVREGADYCAEAGGSISHETAALLAMLLDPGRADCALAVGAALGDDGLVRLGRLMVRDRAERSARPEIRAQAAWLLQYRLPAADPVKLAESLNVVGWRLQHRFGDHAEAVAVFQKAIASDPAFSWPYHNIGRAYLDQKDYAQAREWLLRALEVNPDHWRAQFNLGIAAHRLQRFDEALAAYARAAAMNPDDANAHANLGWVLLKLGRRTEAIRELQTAVRLDPRLDAERRYLATSRAQAPPPAR